jgi:hypothetical protein
MEGVRSRAIIRAVCVAGSAVAFCLMSSMPAQAWSWSSTVYLKGTAGCANVGGIQAITARAALDGKTFTSTSSTNGNNYQIQFTNVRSGRVPSGGGWAWVVVSCSLGGYHQAWVEMYRPGWGDTLIRNF